MRIHRLELQAFGPYASAEAIDFDALSAQGLHLIHGATGAGKTSILDAICYALYGRVPGARTGQRATLVSDHAAPGTRPVVTLEFTVAGRRLRIERSPEHTAPKKRGTGTTTRPAKVLIEERRNGAWEALGTRLDEVGAVVTDLLGMQIDQFAQVVLLPQGEFARFLRARPEERSDVLRRLFDITRFSDTESYLVDRRKQLRATVEQCHQDLRGHLARAEEALSEIDTDLGHGAWAQAPVDDLIGLIDDATQTLSVQVTAAMSESDAAAQTLDRAQHRHQEAVATARLREQAAEAACVVAEFERTADDRRVRCERLDAARRADLVAPHHAVRERRRRAVESATSVVQQTSGAACRSGLLEPTDDTAIGRAVIEQLDTRMREGEHALQPAEQLAGRVEVLTGRLTTQRTNLQRAQADLSGCTERLEMLAAAVAAAAGEIEKAEAKASGAAEAERTLELVQSATQAVAEADEHSRSRDEAARAAQAAATTFAELEQRVLSLRARRLDGIAAELAVDLVDGSPCAVCGSTSHPSPAQAAVDSVTADDIVVAESAAREAEQTLTGCRERLSTENARQVAAGALRDRACQQLAAESADEDALAVRDVDGDELQDLLASRLQSARTDLEAARAARTDLERMQAEQQSRQLETEQTREALAAARDEVAAATAAVRSTTEDLDDTCRRLHAALQAHSEKCACPSASGVTGGDSPDGVEVTAAARDRLAQHRIHRDVVDSLVSADRDLTAAEGELATAVDELATALEEQEFAGEEDFGAAMMTPSDRKALQSALESETEAHTKAQGMLDLPDVQAAMAAPEPDPAATAEAVAEAKHAARVAQTRAAAAERAHRSLTTLHSRVQETLDAGASDRRELQVLEPLTDVVTGSGDNVLRMRLTSYVLAARLESVTALANEKLHTMTGGRYSLEHTDDLARGGMKSGLGLRVRDAWTGRTRDTATLSGGESFMASLALALGLGDAVLHDAGGRELQTLFVDEGFGSLDEESLEQVMEVLDALRAGGRAVGIVSHVRELRDRIPAQIVVHKTSQGSTIDVVTGPSDRVA